jgi:uncharacterized protein (TIGR03083 family)
MTRASAGDADIRQAIGSECRDLADVLDGLPSPSWDAQTLCDGWRVREVAAHMTMPIRYSKARFVIEVVKARGNFNRMADRCARRDAALHTGELVAALRDEDMRSWKPPGGGYVGALIHCVIHGLDVTVALGIGRRVPEDRIRIVLEGVTKPKSLKFFGVDLTGVELRGDDIDWTFGSGTPVSGTAQDLALVLCGRRLPEGRLQGGPSTRFTNA